MESDSDTDHNRVEFEGYVQKKNTKGYYQNRYFVTQGTVLKYWNDHNSKEVRHL
jgi:hypothetical protein